MGGVDCTALTALLVDALKMLAAPASAQIEYLIEHRVDEDELALQLDDVLPAVVSNSMCLTMRMQRSQPSTQSSTA